jgi:hypothetical protein
MHEEIEGSHKITDRIAGVQTDIRTENLPNGSLQRYSYINLFGEKQR